MYVWNQLGFQNQFACLVGPHIWGKFSTQEILTAFIVLAKHFRQLSQSSVENAIQAFKAIRFCSFWRWFCSLRTLKLKLSLWNLNEANIRAKSSCFWICWCVEKWLKRRHLKLDGMRFWSCVFKWFRPKYPKFFRRLCRYDQLGCYSWSFGALHCWYELIFKHHW